MLQVCRGRDLGEKAVRAEDRREIRLEDLDRDPALVPNVPSQIYGRHRARTDLMDQRVAIPQRGAEAGEHGTSRHAFYPAGR